MATTKGAPRMTAARKQAKSDYQRARAAARSRLYRLRQRGYRKATAENILPPSIDLKTASTKEIRKAIKALQEWDREKMRKKAIVLEQEPDVVTLPEIWRIAVETLLDLTGGLAARFDEWHAAGAHTATKWILSMIEKYGIYQFGRMLVESGANEELSHYDILMTSDDTAVREVIYDFYKKIGMDDSIIIEIRRSMEEYIL